MRLRVRIKRFFVRYVNAAVNDYAYQNFLRNTRKKMLELKYDLKELDGLYRRKEKEKREELKRNIADLQRKKDRLQSDYDEQNKKDEESLTKEYLNRRAFFERKSAELLNELEGLELKKMALQKEIARLENEISDKTGQTSNKKKKKENKKSDEKKKRFFSKAI